MNTICSQCGSVLPSGMHFCNFCNTSESVPKREMPVRLERTLSLDESSAAEWRGELDQRLQAYRAKRRKSFINEGQTSLPFGDDGEYHAPAVVVQVDDPVETPPPAPTNDFSFTIAIGRPARRDPDEGRLLIDVSVPPQTNDEDQPAVATQPLPSTEFGLYPAASLYERRKAAIIDGACLAFAYGGFLTLFGSLGGHFTLSKLSATICFFTFAFVYLQYFGLFTIFGGTTPGMMIRGLQMASFSGGAPTSRQLSLRALGYMISAGTLFMGFLWAMWDEDGLTWHDRISRTYLAAPDPLMEHDGTKHPVSSHS